MTDANVEHNLHDWATLLELPLTQLPLQPETSPVALLRKLQAETHIYGKLIALGS